MKCIKCGHRESKVLDTRPTIGGRWRRRQCAKCGFKFSTTETINKPQINREAINKHLEAIKQLLN